MSRTQLETHSQQQLKHKIHRLTKEAPLISNKRRSTKRLLILTLTVVLSVTALAVAGWHYGQSAWLGLLGLWPMLKSSLTAKSLWALLKKTPWLLLIGVKKYAMKLVAMVIGTRVSARNPWVRDKIAYGQALVQEKTALLTARWSSLNFIERALLIVISVHLVLAVLLIMLLSKSLQIFALKSGSEKTAEQLVLSDHTLANVLMPTFFGMAMHTQSL